MDASVLDSIYNLLTSRNPLMLGYHEAVRSVRSLVNLQRNRRRAEVRLGELNNRMRAISMQIEAPKGQVVQPRMDCYR